MPVNQSLSFDYSNFLPRLLQLVFTIQRLTEISTFSLQRRHTSDYVQSAALDNEFSIPFLPIDSFSIQIIKSVCAGVCAQTELFPYQ